jgi:hypothetical protein
VATWKDGPEYAPVAWPAAFACVDAPPLTTVTPEANPATGRPGERPVAYDVPPQPGLATYEVTHAETRDPREGFAVVSSVMTASAWGSRGAELDAAWSPEKPLSVPGGSAVMHAQQPAASVPVQRQSTFPTQQAWVAAPPGAAPAARIPVSLKAAANATTPGVLITLLLGGLLPWVSVALFFLAFWLTSRVRYRTSQVRGVMSALASGIGLVAVIGYYGDAIYGLGAWWNQVAPWACAACWIALVTVPLVVRDGLARGERPSA